MVPGGAFDPGEGEYTPSTLAPFSKCTANRDGYDDDDDGNDDDGEWRTSREWEKEYYSTIWNRVTWGYERAERADRKNKQILHLSFTVPLLFFLSSFLPLWLKRIVRRPFCWDLIFVDVLHFFVQEVPW